MRAGAMDRRITIQTPSYAADAVGQQVETWGTLADVWAEVVPTGGRELIAGGLQAEQMTTFRIRYRTGVTRTCRISYGGDTYDIQAIKELGRQAGLEITGKAMVS